MLSLFNIKFYLVAIFFVVFDLEALYLYAWATSVREVGWFGFTTVVIFVVDLLIALIYAISVGALNWAPVDRRKSAGVPLKIGSPNMNLADITRFNSIEELQAEISVAAAVDNRIGKETVLVVSARAPGQRLVLSPTGPLDRDYDDVRSFYDAAK